MQPIDQKTYFAKVMNPNPENVCTPTETGELSEAEFLMNAQDILQEGFERGQDIDYVTDRVFDLIKNNPKLADKNHLPTERPEIKTKVVEPYLKERASEGFDVGKTAECLMEKSDSIISHSVSAYTNYQAKNYKTAVVSGIAVIKQVAGCVKEGL